MVSTDPVSLATTIIMIFPMMYFGIATLTFFLAKMSDPIVTNLLRGLFNVYFRVVTILCSLSALAYLHAGKPVVTLGLAGVAVLAIYARRWFIGSMDAEIAARDAGNAEATRRLRRLHVGGIAYNLAQMAAIIASIPFMLGGSA